MVTIFLRNVQKNLTHDPCLAVVAYLQVARVNIISILRYISWSYEESIAGRNPTVRTTSLNGTISHMMTLRYYTEVDKLN
jgi:hypothetical protein